MIANDCLVRYTAFAPTPSALSSAENGMRNAVLRVGQAAQIESAVFGANEGGEAVRGVQESQKTGFRVFERRKHVIE